MKSGALLTPILAFCVCSAMSDGDSGLVSGPFFGQQASRESASLFMDGFISTEVEPQMNAAFSIDGREFLYCTRHQGSWAIFTTREEDGRWLKPEPIPFASKFNDRDFTMAPNGKTIFFGSDRPRIPGGPRQESLDIFSSTRAPDSQWMEPVNVGPSINSEAGENYPSVAANGNLYFFSCREDRFGGCDLYVSEFREGKYQPSRILPGTINSDHHDWDAYIAPDESYIIFSSQDRADSIGAQDLYIAFRGTDGGWGTARNMGRRVNSSSDEICPSVSLDGQFFFFTSRRRGVADIYWMTTDIVEEMRP